MKRFLLFFLFAFGCVAANAQADGWSAYMMPGFVHKQLAPYVGAWKVRMSVWSAAQAQPESFDLDAAIEPLMDGRFFQVHIYGSIMGMNYDSREQLGHNNLDGTFTHISFSSFGTAFTILQGKWNEATKVATLAGETLSPEDKKKIALREVIKFIGLDQIVFEYYDTREGQKEFMSMEMVLERKKGY